MLALGVLSCGSDDDLSPPEPSTPTFSYPADDTLRLHHLQALSTHNSYHLEPEGNELVDWMYSHEPLDVQLDALGVRHVELDLRYDWAEERFEVYHLPVIDEDTTCRRFTECLERIESWSAGHPGHHPVVVQLEIKDGLPADPQAYWSGLHDEIDSVIPRGDRFQPADVEGAVDRGLGDVIADEGWPTLGALRGRVLFMMDNGGELRDSYTHGGQHVNDRILFPSSTPGDPFAAVAVINDPFDQAAIDAALAANMLVRTRADAGVAGAQANDITSRDAALASGAHFITTDFPAPTVGMEYFVQIPGGTPSRCNPVTAPAECTAPALEAPDQLGSE